MRRNGCTGEAPALQLGSTSFRVVDADITALAVDAIVNSANTHLELGGRRSIAGAIQRKTGGRIDEVLAEFERPIPIGSMVVTEGLGLPCKHIFHVATHGTIEEEEVEGMDHDTLRLKAVGDSAVASVAEARRLGCRSLAVPALATGALRFPISLVMPVLVNTLVDEIRANGADIELVYIVVYRDPAKLAVAEQALRSAVADAANVLHASSGSASAGYDTAGDSAGRLMLEEERPERYAPRTPADSRAEKPHGKPTRDQVLSGALAKLTGAERQTMREILIERSNLAEQVRALEEQIVQLNPSYSPQRAADGKKGGLSAVVQGSNARFLHSKKGPQWVNDNSASFPPISTALSRWRLARSA